MRISDWSSDVCSSDLLGPLCRTARRRDGRLRKRPVGPARLSAILYVPRRAPGRRHRPPPLSLEPREGDRKSVVSGKSVSVRVDLGGRRSIKKKKNTEV